MAHTVARAISETRLALAVAWCFLAAATGAACTPGVTEGSGASESVTTTTRASTLLPADATERSLGFLAHPGVEWINEPLAVDPSVLIFEHTNSFPLKDEADSYTEVTLSLVLAPHGAALTCDGGLTRQATAGLVEWHGCSVDKVGNYLFAATAPGLATVTGYVWLAVAGTGTLATDGEPLTLWTMDLGKAARFTFEASGEHEYLIFVGSPHVTNANVELLLPGRIFPFTEFDIATNSKPIELARSAGTLLEAGTYHLDVRGHARSVSLRSGSSGRAPRVLPPLQAASASRKLRPRKGGIAADG